MKNKQPRKPGSERSKQQPERPEEEQTDDIPSEKPPSTSGSGREHSGVSDHTRKLMGCILAALVFSAVTGCITMGQSFRTEAVKSIVIGKTKQNEVELLFGMPYRTGIESGDLTWTYLNYHFSVLGTQQTTDLYVRFNSDETVKSYAFNTNVPDHMPK